MRALSTRTAMRIVCVRCAHLTDGRRTSDMIDSACGDGAARGMFPCEQPRPTDEDAGLAAFTAADGVHG